MVLKMQELATKQNSYNILVIELKKKYCSVLTGDGDGDNIGEATPVRTGHG